MAFVYALIATFIVSLISLVGVFALWIKSDKLDKFLFILVGFAAGSLIGTAFLHILTEALEKTSAHNLFLYTIVGFTLFFVMERGLWWRHCHDDHCAVHPFTYLSLICNSAHNMTDGVIIAISFMTDIKLGFAVTLAIIFHEIPHEIGDFSILVCGGFSKSKALLFNFISGLSAVVGTVLGYFLSTAVNNASEFLLPFAAGGFIYIASSDLIPEIHRHPSRFRANMSSLAFILGIVFMYLVRH